MNNEVLRVAIVTVSDRASRGEYEDRSGPAIVEWLDQAMKTPWDRCKKVIADEQITIEETLITLCDVDRCHLIVTTGGTGPAPRDVTPDATEVVCQKMMPGFGELMRQESLKIVPTAILSRQTAGIRGSTLIVNLPGKPSAIKDCLDAVFPAIPYCIELLEGPYVETHDSFCQAFRPKHAIIKREEMLRQQDDGKSEP
jgi:molybdopterin adenylyltransferase